MADIIKLNEALSQMAKTRGLKQTDKTIALDNKGNLVSFPSTEKKKNNIQPPVTIMRAIPPHPKKGMRYYFDDYIRFRFKDDFFIKGGTVTIPNNGGKYHFFIDNDGIWNWQDAKNGQTFTKQSLGISDNSDAKNLVICKEIKEPTIVKIINDEGLSILTTTYEELTAPDVLPTTSSWYGVKNGKIVGIKATHPHIQVGQVINTKNLFYYPILYTIYQYKKKGCILNLRKFINEKKEDLEINRYGWFRKFKPFKDLKKTCMLHIKIGSYDYRDSWIFKKKKFKRQVNSLVECYALYENGKITIKKIVK